MPLVVWVYRCNDGCEGLAFSYSRVKIQKTKQMHKDLMGHNGTISREDRALIDEGYEEQDQ